MTGTRNASSEVMRRAVDQLPSMIGYWDSSLRNVYANQVYADYFGIEPRDLVGKHLSELLGEALFQLNEPYITGVLAGEQQQFDRTLIDVNGAVRVTQATYVPDIVDGVVVGFTALVVDVSARAEVERERDRAIRLFQNVMENAPIGKAVMTRDGRWLQVNKALCELLGYTAEELRQKTFRDITHPDDIPLADEHLKGLADGTLTNVASEKRYIRKDGATIWVQRNATVVRDDESGDVIIAQIQDITARKAAEASLERQVLIDDLTALGNRRRLMAELDALKESVSERPVGMLFVDIDSFKSINDRFGHAVGDRVLQAIGRRILDNTRTRDIACRIGGDEFVALLHSARSAEGVERLANRVRGLLAGPYDIDGIVVPVSVSVGWSWEPTTDPDELLRIADERMYSSKRA
ncbi:PAS domain S-box protein [Rhodococcus sp. IEGM 1401]|uniref:PAS domain S-box protein n=1 Tax=Rhodococcus cercidiphylli TaxID=489916 RepID=A0ABU4AVP8_9NOCA|nr:MULTISPECIES: PAS domain S-box protein [Rhodococcus]MCZ4563651.1 PAS domain S-box protein [Rhodococcus sp. IEGM 1401]MDI9923739.1 PAS domain S-box protein [Rhodococcus sp. IEGM 1372]MDV6230307.1 PAS domain S-box protein [Rhodococcus cercidiphylli]MDV8036232.1 PAS domain S-box protein [Rhodococcus sp. IEGM 1414]MDV8078364.1 PAS domain S-box protein [Rhodococcus sp. IEGM 1370]